MGFGRHVNILFTVTALAFTAVLAPRTCAAVPAPLFSPEGASTPPESARYPSGGSDGKSGSLRVAKVNHEILLNGDVDLNMELASGVKVIGKTSKHPNAQRKLNKKNGKNANLPAWVGDVDGYPLGTSFAAFMVSESDNSTYGLVTLHDTKQNKKRVFVIEPVLLKQSSDSAARLANPKKDPNGLHYIYETQEVNLKLTYLMVNAKDIKPSKQEVSILPAGGKFSNVKTEGLNLTGFTADTTMPADVPPGATSADAAKAAGLPVYVNVKNRGSIDAAKAEATNATALGSSVGGRRLLQAGGASINRFDLLMLYTPAAQADAGGPDSIINRMRLGVAFTNKAYADSQINAYVNIVGISRVEYREADPLGDLAGGRVPNALSMRESFGADLVTMYARASAYCGVGLMTIPFNTDAMGFSVINQQCWNGRTLAHEMGHNQGCRHNVEDGRDGFNVKPYAFGYRRCNLGRFNFGTIMSYGCPNGVSTPSLAVFSNPNLLYNGVPAGHPTDGHCARAIQDTAAQVAARRVERTTTASSAIATLQPLATRCLDVYGYNYANGARPVLWDCDGQQNQQLQFLADGSLRFLGTNKCLDAQTPSSYGTPAQVWDCNGGLNQKWFLDSSNRLRPYSDPTWCVDIPSGSTALGTAIQMWECISNNPNQRWAAPLPRFAPNNNAIKSRLNNMCLDVYAFNYSPGAAVVMWQCNGLTNQGWIMDNLGRIRATGNNNFCLDANNPNAQAPVYIYPCHSFLNQRWFYDSMGRLRTMSNPNMCLDIIGANTALGTRIQLWPCLDVPQHKWFL